LKATSSEDIFGVFDRLVTEEKALKAGYANNLELFS
jgi:hypothetical protein